MLIIVFLLGLGLGFGVRSILLNKKINIVQPFNDSLLKDMSSGVSDLEIQEVTNFLAKFETLQKSRKYIVLDLFTPPADSKETQVLGFLLGKDIRMIRMYATAGLDYQLDWYYVESISKNDNRITVKLKELRTRYGNSNGEYNATRNDLVMEVVEKNGKLWIDKYHHKIPLVEGSLKYEGFY